MKKYLNKGLLYQWFNAAKAPIIIGIIAWGFIANDMLSSNLGQTIGEISNLYSDYFISARLDQYEMLGFIFLSIYFITVGVNKRNNLMFLSSGPYTKKQIKYNELISLLITLGLFVITFIYISITFYIRNVEVLSIITGYERIIVLEIIRLILLGIVGIIFMLIMDTLFSNSVIGVIGMIFVIPGSIFITLIKIGSILRYWGVGNNKSLDDKIYYLIHGTEEYKYNPSALLDSTSLKYLTFKQLAIEIIFTLVIIMIMIIIFNLAQRKYKLENCNKIFSSRINENVVVILTSIGIASFLNVLVLDQSNYAMIYKTGQFLPLIGMDLMKALGKDILSLVIVGFIAYKLIKKILKAIG